MSFVGASDISDEIYERIITIENWAQDVNGNSRLVTSTVRVPTINRDIVVTLETVLSAWSEL